MRLACAAIAVLLTACSVDAVDLENRACPCIEGWYCNPVTEICDPMDGSVVRDAGMDARAIPDAFTPSDSGMPVMDMDSGAPDAGRPDAGPPDAGPPDAGPWTIELSVEADAYVDNSMTTVSFGAVPELLVDGDPAYRGTLIRLDDPGLPASTEIVSATLEVTCFDAGSIVEVFRVTEAWSESVTWDTRPARDDTAVVASFAPAIGRVSMDVTDLVQAWVDGSAPNHGVVLLTDGTDGSDYRSSEHSVAAERPRLVVVYR